MPRLPAGTTLTEVHVILPKLSAAILSMALLGSAYAAPARDADTTLDQWVLISGATNGAADALGVSEDDLDEHRNTARSHLTRYAAEHGMRMERFDALFDLGANEGRRLVSDRVALARAKGQSLIDGFQRDKIIGYESVKDALDV